jgi:peptidyl-prolyl cis-trans isomerase C
MSKFFPCLLTLTLLLPGALSAQETAVARIGDRKITAAELDRWMSYNPSSGSGSEASDNKMKAAMLNQIVTGMVIADIARKEGFAKRPDTREKMELVINNFLTLEYLDKVVAASVTASEDQILQYYEQHKDDFTVRDSVHVRHILIKSGAEDPAEAKGEARRKAEDLVKQLRDGAEFSALAAQHSHDPGSRDRGGDLGFVHRGRMVPAFEEVAFALPPGQVSGVVETRFGYHVIKVDERREGSVKPVGEVRSIIENKLTRDRRREAVDAFVQKAMKEADAEVDVRALVGSDPHFGH